MGCRGEPELSPNLCFFSYKQKDGSCRSTGTVMFVTPIGAQIGRQASQPPLLLSVFWSLGENANSKSRKSSKGKTKLLNEPSAFGLQPPCSSSHLLGTEAPGRFWGLKQRRLLCPSRNLVTCVRKHWPYHTVPHLTTPQHTDQSRPGFCNQRCV